jgi:hypothetical protein
VISFFSFVSFVFEFAPPGAVNLPRRTPPGQFNVALPIDRGESQAP